MTMSPVSVDLGRSSGDTWRTQLSPQSSAHPWTWICRYNPCKIYKCQFLLASKRDLRRGFHIRLYSDYVVKPLTASNLNRVQHRLLSGRDMLQADFSTLAVQPWTPQSRHLILVSDNDEKTESICVRLFYIIALLSVGRVCPKNQRAYKGKHVHVHHPMMGAWWCCHTRQVWNETSFLKFPVSAPDVGLHPGADT